MSVLKNENLLSGFSGKIHGVVFRQCHGRTILSSAPRRDRRRRSEKQLAHQMHFREAVFYARQAMQDPEKAKELSVRMKPGETVYQCAIAEYFRNLQR